ncbi:MAG: T9SS type A sorting domain-containing protein [Sphingobacteriaceae bacterium]|nr:T9SS type A sorting domain-containing protein [Sphingobacteriaceae bacterium]
MDVRENYSIYPNPTENGIIHISGLNEGSKIEIVNTLGELVYSGINESKIMDIDLSSIANGVYVVNLKTTNAKHSYKLILASQ